MQECVCGKKKLVCIASISSVITMNLDDSARMNFISIWDGVFDDFDSIELAVTSF